MKRTSNYNTKQKERISELFQQQGDRHVTAGQISLYLQEQGTPVGMATIYRYLDQLVSEGIIRRYVLDGKSGACYQYVGDHPDACREHFHLKCLACGKLFHVSCSYLNELNQHILEHHDFEVDHTKTVLYGYCSACRKKQTCSKEQVQCGLRLKETVRWFGFALFACARQQIFANGGMMLKNIGWRLVL